MDSIEQTVETVFWRIRETVSGVQAWLGKMWGELRLKTFFSPVHDSGWTTDKAMLVSHSNSQEIEHFLVKLGASLLLSIWVASNTSQPQEVVAIRELHTLPTTVYHHVCPWLAANSEAFCRGGVHDALPETFLCGEITVVLGLWQDQDGELLQSVETNPVYSLNLSTGYRLSIARANNDTLVQG